MFETVLYQSVLFKNFEYEEFLAVFPLLRGTLRAVNKGVCLQDVGEKITSVGVVVSGGVNTFMHYANGKQSILDALGPAKLFGLDMVLTPTRRSTLTIKSVMPTEAFVFPFQGLETIHALPEEIRYRLLENILIYIANENIRKQHKIEIISQNGLRDRILTCLRMFSRRRRSSSFAISFTREEFADYLCVNRSALSHELSKMQQEGILTFRKDHFTLHELFQ